MTDSTDIPLTLLPQLRLSLFHRRNHHITNTSIREPVQAGTKSKGFDNVQRFRTTVVCAVEDGASGQTEGHAEFVTACSSTCQERKEKKKQNENKHLGYVCDGCGTYRALTCFFEVC